MDIISKTNKPKDNAETESSSQQGFKKYAPLIVLSLALAIIIIDSTVLNVSISQIIIDLKTDIKSIQWVISIYTLVLGALTIAGGRLGDIFGRKRMFVLGAAIFACGSLMASFSNNITTLLIGWSIIEGIGAALMMPATSSLLLSTYHGRDRAIAFGIWGGIAAAASAIGPIFGGYLTTNVSWHWAFRINVFVVLALIAGSFIIKESRDTKEKKQLDIIGAVLSGLALFFIVFGIIQSSTYGWLQAKKPFDFFGSAYDLGGISIVPFAVITGGILLAIFAWWQRRLEKLKKTPLISLNMFRSKQFSAGIIAIAILSLGQTGLFFSVPIFLQSVRHLNAFDTGVAFLPLSLSILIVAPLSAFISKKIAPKILVLIGMVINFAAIFVLRDSINLDATVSSLAPGLVLYGIGMGLVMSQINNIALSAVPVFQAGEASGVSATIRQIGGSLGSAVIGAIFLSTFTASLVSGINSSSILPDPAKQAIVQNVQTAGTDLEFKGTDSANVPPQIAAEMLNLTNDATVQGNKDALNITAVFTVLGMLVTLGLPNNKNLEKNEYSTGSH